MAASLTGLPTDADLREELRRRSGDRFSRIDVELVGLATFGLEHGPGERDGLIRALARDIVEVCGPDAFAADVGGGRFAVLLPPGSARTVASAIERRFARDGRPPLRLTVAA